MKENEVVSIEGLRIGYQDSNGWHDGPNTVGGVSLSLAYTNRHPTPIKYIVFCLVPYNNVGDIVPCRVRGRAEARARDTGPLQQGKVNRGIWDNLWYNSSITSVKITKIEIEYMDGTKKEVDGSEVEVKENKGGCYIATAVYGSYNCPEVWTLRRYRDNSLAKTWYGRAFIHMYYAMSPTAVRLFGSTAWFNGFWRHKLDQLVAALKRKGYSDSPYSDQ